MLFNVRGDVKFETQHFDAWSHSPLMPLWGNVVQLGLPHSQALLAAEAVQRGIEQLLVQDRRAVRVGISPRLEFFYYENKVSAKAFDALRTTVNLQYRFNCHQGQE